MVTMQRHFARVAPRYGMLRTTDTDPVRVIAQELSGLHSVVAADVGCGTGRYDLSLFEQLGGRLFLHCIDSSKAMLRELERRLRLNEIREFAITEAEACQLPLEDRSLDSVFTFNAVHHFNVPAFLHEAARVLRKGGLLFIYTRLWSQNAGSIWGRHFPRFLEEEVRLLELEELLAMARKVPRLIPKRIEFFRYRRQASLGRLLEQARGRHYSTFSMYKADEFEQALKEFEQALRAEFPDHDSVEWLDQNTMLVLRNEVI